MEPFQNVFDCHPDVNEIFVVNGMPFLSPDHAVSHSNSTGHPVESVKRPSVPEEGSGPVAPEASNSKKGGAKKGGAKKGNAKKRGGDTSGAPEQ